jgi:hypothetical protein
VKCRELAGGFTKSEPVKINAPVFDLPIGLRACLKDQQMDQKRCAGSIRYRRTPNSTNPADLGQVMNLHMLRQLNAARLARQAAILVTDTSSGEGRLVSGDAVAGDVLARELRERIASGRSGLLDDGRTFLTVHVPPPRLVLIGAVHISQALAPMARAAGFDVTIIDPRTAFATPERFADVKLLAEWPDVALDRITLDRFTALAALTHDPKMTISHCRPRWRWLLLYRRARKPKNPRQAAGTSAGLRRAPSGAHPCADRA